MDFKDAKNLNIGDEVYVIGHYRSDGVPTHVKITGRVKLWVTRPNEIQIPYKWGIRGYGHITEGNLDSFTLERPECIARRDVKTENAKFRGV